MTQRLSPDAAGRLIDQLGGTTQVAKKCGISTAAVSQWRRDGINRVRLTFLRSRYPSNPFQTDDLAIQAEKAFQDSEVDAVLRCPV